MITRRDFLKGTGLGIAGSAIMSRPASATGTWQPRTNITMFRGNPTKTFYGTGPLRDRLRVVWKYEMGGYFSPAHGNKPAKTWRGTGWTGTAVVVDGKVYVGSLDSHLYAFDGSTGRVLWRYKGGAMFKSSACYYDGKLYIGNVDNHLHCVDAASGRRLWRYNSHHDLDSSPVPAEGRIFVGGEAGWMHAFSPWGQLIWRTFLGGDRGEPGSCGVETSPSVWNGRVYAATYEGKLYCLSTRDGSVLWVSDTGDDTDVSPVIWDGKVYIAAEEKSPYVFCFDALNGRQIWKFGGWRTGGFWSTPAVADGRVYIGANSGRFYCLDAHTGSVVWEIRIPRPVWSSPALVDGKLLFGSYDAHLYMVDASSGRLIFRKFMGARVLSSPVVADGRVFVGTAGGMFYCLE